MPYVAWFIVRLVDLGLDIAIFIRYHTLHPRYDESMDETWQTLVEAILNIPTSH